MVEVAIPEETIIDDPAGSSMLVRSVAVPPFPFVSGVT